MRPEEGLRRASEAYDSELFEKSLEIVQDMRPALPRSRFLSWAIYFEILCLTRLKREQQAYELLRDSFGDLEHLEDGPKSFLLSVAIDLAFRAEDPASLVSWGRQCLELSLKEERQAQSLQAAERVCECLSFLPTSSLQPALGFARHLLRAGSAAQAADGLGYLLTIALEARSAPLLREATDALFGDERVVADYNCLQTLAEVEQVAGFYQTLSAQTRQRIDKGKQLLAACDKGDQQAVTALLEQKVSPNFQGFGRVSTPLMACSERQCARLLLDAGAQVGLTNHQRQTAMMLAAEAGRTDCVAVLLAAGSPVDATDLLGRTALHYAAYRGQVGAAGLLLDGNLELVDVAGMTPLLAATSTGSYEVAELLLRHGANPDQRDRTGRDATDWALQTGLKELFVTRVELQHAAAAELLPAPEAQPGALEVAYEPDEVPELGICSRCEELAPTRCFKFYEHKGMLLAGSTRRFEGEFCRECAMELFVEVTSSTFLMGWWGFYSVFATPYYLLKNLLDGLRLMGLRPAGAIRTLDRPSLLALHRTRPLIKRLLDEGQPRSVLVARLAEETGVGNDRAARYLRMTLMTREGKVEMSPSDT